MKITQIKETCLYVGDLEASTSFYRDKLGLEQFAYDKSSHAFFRAGTSVLLCFLPEVSKMQSNLPPHYALGNIHFAFEVEKDDYEKCKEEIEETGINIEHEEAWSGGYLSFYFRDPDNHLVEIVQKGMWGG